jgi:hypothetical protein
LLNNKYEYPSTPSRHAGGKFHLVNQFPCFKVMMITLVCHITEELPSFKILTTKFLPSDVMIETVSTTQLRVI